jgi:hypothetical protein
MGNWWGGNLAAGLVRHNSLLAWDLGWQEPIGRLQQLQEFAALCEMISDEADERGTSKIGL